MPIGNWGRKAELSRQLPVNDRGDGRAEIPALPANRYHSRVSSKPLSVGFNELLKLGEMLLDEAGLLHSCHVSRRFNDTRFRICQLALTELLKLGHTL